MKKLIVIHHNNQNYDVGGLVRFLIKIFNNEKYRKILIEKYNFEVITSYDIQQSLNITEEDLLKNINSGPDFVNSVFFGIHPYGLGFMSNIRLLVKNSKNIKCVGWINDPHIFAYGIKDRQDRKISVQKYSETYQLPHMSYLDYLVSPSLIYFKNLKIKDHEDRMIDMFYFINPECVDHINEIKYLKRKDQIILSGSVKGGYISRVNFNGLIDKNIIFKEIIYKLEHPGYKNNEHMTEMNYYNKLSEFKGAFVGHHEFPLNYLLAKHIEVLMCGCLGFFEPNPLLESQLGLKEYVHYIPCYKNGNLIDDPDFYTEWLKNGEEIAKNGQKFVMENFGEKQIHKLFQFLASIK